MANPRLTLIGLYNYDNSLFDNLKLPEEIDKNIFINNLLLKYGEFGVLYSNFDFMKFAIKSWGQKYFNSFIRINKALTEEYNPIHNFDRFEDLSDTDSSERKSTDSKNSTITATNSIVGSNEVDENSESRISAYNSETYQPDNSNTTNTSQNNRSTSTSEQGQNDSTSNSEEEKHTSTHTGHLYGNIGVTKSQDMVKDEINLRSNYNIYDIMSEIFKCEFLIMIY